jgi:High-affinity nickel-transport protein
MIGLISIIVLGFFLGMRHATDPDHVIAVTTIVARYRKISHATLIGAFGGVGHTLTILVVGTGIILFGWIIPKRVGLWPAGFVSNGAATRRGACARPGRLRGCRTSGVGHNSESKMGCRVPACVWDRDDCGNDVHYRSHGAAFCICRQAFFAPESRAAHRVGPDQRGVRAFSCMRDWFRKRSLHQSSKLDTSLIYRTILQFTSLPVCLERMAK